MPIPIDQLRAEIEEKLIGFRPNTGKVKPVHIANGLFRSVLEQVSVTERLNQFVISHAQKGIPAGHEADKVFADLRENGRLDEVDVRFEDITRLRLFLRKMVAADDAVFPGTMASYTAGQASFVSSDHIGQDGGEFIGEWLKHRKLPLYDCIKQSLSERDDIISLACAPLLDTNVREYTPRFDYDQYAFMGRPKIPQIKELWTGLADAATTLAKHLEQHPNKLLRLRLSVLFTAFTLMRYLTSLEATIPGQDVKAPAFLLDFSSSNNAAPIARASTMTYMNACQSVARYYAWAFAERLQDDYSLRNLSTEPTPTYGARGKAKKGRDLSEQRRKNEDARQVWEIAIQVAKQEKSYRAYGEALYNILALQTEGNPVTYLKRLGLLSGWLYPPNQPAQRLVLKQDLLETLVRGALEPGQSVSIGELQERFWSHYRIIIGGRPEDEDRLVEIGVYQADGDALDQNKLGFAEALGQLNFASLLADGVLQVSSDGAK